MVRSILLICLLVPSLALAYEPERARTNMAHEAAECVAYFITVSQAPRLDTETKDHLLGYGKSLIEMSAKLTTEKLAHARADLASKTMLRELDGDWGNISILNNKYGYPCKDLIADPNARMQYWFDKRD